MCCSMKVTQFFFLLVDIIFLLMGVGMVGIGVWVQMEQADVMGVLVDSKYVSVPLIMIAAGIIVTVVSIIGCIGALMKQRCCLIMFVVCVILVFIMELAVGIIAFLHRDEIENSLRKQLLDGMKNERSHASWDVIQKEFSCCGVDGPRDWYIDSTAVPDSCCRLAGCGLLGATNAYTIGCFDQAKQKIQDNFYYLGAAAIGLGVCQVIAIISGIALLVMLWRERRGKVV